MDITESVIKYTGIKICSLCGMCNAVPDDDDKNLKNKKIKCGMCYANLNLYIPELLQTVLFVLKNLLIVSWGIGTLLDELLTMGYGDIFDDVNTNKQKNILQHDLTIIRNYFRRNMLSVTTIAPNLDK